MDGQSVVRIQQENDQETVMLSLDCPETKLFREVLRQQILGDRELLRDAIAGREDPEIRLQVYDRMRLCRRLGEVVGLGEVEQRREPVREHGYVRVPIHWIVCVAAILVSTAAVYTTYWLGLGANPVLYAPIAAWATRRQGKKAGVITATVCALAYLALDPTQPTHAIRGLIVLVSLVFAIWVIRRDVF